MARPASRAVPELDRQSIASLKGVGAQTLLKLEKLGLHTLQDLLFHLPLRYEDRTQIMPIGSLRAGQSALIEGRVELTELVTKGRNSLVIRIRDGSGFINLKFFHFSQDQRRQFEKGRLVRCYGEIREGFYGAEITHPDYQLVRSDEAGIPDATLTPIYPLTEGIHQKSLRRLIHQALEAIPSGLLPDWIPSDIIADDPAWPDISDALRTLHAPVPGSQPDSKKLQRARRRLAYEELLAHQLTLGRYRSRMQQHRSPILRLSPVLQQDFLSRLPFELTGAQQRVCREISLDLAKPHPMMRLVQGDVGSGKTVVAAHATLVALSSNQQTAIMAPTELLAEQHAHSFRQWLEPLGVTVAFIAAKTKGEARRKAVSDTSEGRAGVVVGTHALFQESIRFQQLGLVIIDEQHRFGVHQRLALRDKGAEGDVYPHQLIMTATPIPRTLAMLGYADLDLSVIDERPPGRTPINTVVLPATRREAVTTRISQWVEQKRQVYWVCTLIEESEVLQAEAAEQAAVRLSEALPMLRVALIHGRLKSSEKDSLMQAFKAGDIDILVATTVIEVGVDVPNASLMVIENAERLGLAQLHQLRGRVGRGPGEAHCVLMYQTPLSQTARERLGVLRDTDDGFIIAEKDLEIRGPGELLGIRQTGQVQFRVADLARDAHLLDSVQTSAAKLMQDYPHHVDPLIRRWTGASGHRYAEA